MFRREFMKSSLAAGVGMSLASPLFGQPKEPAPKPRGTADAMILIWLPGGIAQTDTWDPKKFTPYTAGMKGSEILGTCPSIHTAADGVFWERASKPSPR